MPERPPLGENGDTAAYEEQLTEAALWLERLSHGADEGTRASFECWLAASALNASAFESVRHTHDFTRGAADRPEILALRQQTLARTMLGPASTRRRARPFLQNHRSEGHGETTTNSRNGRAKAVVAAGFATCLGVGIWLAAGQGLPVRERASLSAEAVREETIYRTEVGEQSTIELADGSQIVLNTASAVRVAYSGSARRVTLDHGQAFFTVAKEAGRPFTVEADGRVVTAFGTAFDVRIQKETVQIALLEGKVSVSPRANAQQGTVMLKPNDMLIADKNALEVVKLANPASFTAWREGLLIFQNDELQSAVEEMNRYSATRIVLNDEAVAHHRISGTFRIGQTTAFLEALRGMFPIHAEKRGDEEIVLTAN
jgi:transmembrane sensor